jgi:hypothetical protein
VTTHEEVAEPSVIRDKPRVTVARAAMSITGKDLFLGDTHLRALLVHVSREVASTFTVNLWRLKYIGYRRRYPWQKTSAG